MLLNHEQSKLWDAAVFLVQHNRISETQPILKVLFHEILELLGKSNLTHYLKVTFEDLSLDDVNQLRILEQKIKDSLEQGSIQLAHQILIDFLDTMARNDKEILATLLTGSASVMENEKDQEPEEEEDGFYSVGKAAKRLGVSTQTVKRYCETGRIQGAKKTPGGHWRIPKSAFRITKEQYQKAQKTMQCIDEINRSGGEVDDEFNII